MSGVTQSERGYGRAGEVENNPLSSISLESEEDLTRFLPGSAVRLIKERFPLIPPTSTLPLALLALSPSTPTHPTPPPPPKAGMATTIKLPTFQGVGSEEPIRFWFLIKSVWDEQGIIDENIKKATLVSALQDHALTRYIKYSTNHPNEGITVI